MEQKTFDSGYIQTIIGYKFKNPRLLQQAFTRKSYSAEHPEVQDNESLEFYGDVALNLYISMSMCNSFGKIESNQYVSEKNEGELSKIRSWNVNKERLAHCIQLLEFEKFLFLSSSDIKNEAWKSESVCEDLFEAIVGATAIDSNWNSEKIKNVCQNLFSISDFDENYIKLLEEECKKHGWKRPYIWDKNPFIMHNSFNSMNPFFFPNMQSNFPPIPEMLSFKIDNLYEWVSDYNSIDSTTNAKTIMLSAKRFYEWLLQRDKILKVIDNIDENLAANQLNELAQKGLVKNPTYDFSESHDKDGNPIWKCTCKLEEADFHFEASNVSKKKAKQEVAAQALFYLIGKEKQLNKTMETK